MTDRVARRVLVSGLVQGVAFRWSAREAALRLAVHGWVLNLPDRRVEAHIEGAPDAVERMLLWLGEGPPSARVIGVDVRSVPCEGATGFEVRFE